MTAEQTIEESSLNINMKIKVCHQLMSSVTENYFESANIFMANSSIIHLKN